MNNLDSGSLKYDSSNIFTSGPGEYRLNEKRNQINYPWAPTMILQKNGGSLMDENFFDTESEIKNITRKLSNNPKEQYIPGTQGDEVKMKHFKDNGYHQISSRLTNNAFELKGIGINRWEPLFFDPQKNAIEPFRRIGNNTVLNTLDQHVNDCGNI
tara:strand:- start:654 stop:1121 length:468 start_codon:yes stop_codon:yes gene_type:complete